MWPSACNVAKQPAAHSSKSAVHASWPFLRHALAKAEKRPLGVLQVKSHIGRRFSHGVPVVLAPALREGIWLTSEVGAGMDV